MTNDPDIVGRADKWIIPGVGNFKATAPLANGKLGAMLREGRRQPDRPLLGICLGLQWMFEGSSEAPELRGFGAFAGQCTRFSEQREVAARGMGQHRDRTRSRLLAGYRRERMCISRTRIARRYVRDTVATCTYEEPFTAAAERDNLFGVQFHPEKSGDVGMQILENFCAL